MSWRGKVVQDRILALLREHGELSVIELNDRLGVGRRAIVHHVAQLLARRRLVKAVAYGIVFVDLPENVAAEASAP